MGFITYFPLSENPILLNTSGSLDQQLWQQLVMLRHGKRQKHMAAPKATAPWIDQAQTYFLDASRSNWRSGGLLYYYSFLNLAKAFLVGKRVVTYKALNETSIYHGLAADLQPISNITKFEVEVYPPTYQNRKNVFSILCETVTGEQWPHKKKVKIKVADIAGYCHDISAELLKLFGISGKIILTQSMIRKMGENVWFEMVVPQSTSSTVKKQVPNWKLEEIPASRLNENDKNDWLLSFRRTAVSLSNTVVLRSPKHQIDEPQKDDGFCSIALETKKHFAKYAVPTVEENSNFPQWMFIPKVNLLGSEIRWHPLLSDYFMAFVLSTILRYQPQLLNPKNPDCFLAEAWCQQSALSTLRHFLILMSQPPIRIETY